MGIRNAEFGMEIENIPNEKTSKKRPCDCRGVFADNLGIQIDPQSGANGKTIDVDMGTDLEDNAVHVDKGGKILIDAGRPQPPPAVAIVAIDTHSICNCILRGLTLSCTIYAKIFICFGNAE